MTEKLWYWGIGDSFHEQDNFQQIVRSSIKNAGPFMNVWTWHGPTSEKDIRFMDFLLGETSRTIHWKSRPYHEGFLMGTVMRMKEI